MQVQAHRLSPAALTTIAAALEKGVAGAMKDITKIHGRMTEELRAEDAIRALHVDHGKVVADIDGRFDYKPAGLKQTVAEHLAKHGIKNVVISLHTLPDGQKAVDAVNKDIEKIQARKTKDLRAEDGVAGVSFIDNSHVVIALKARVHFGDAEIANAVKGLLAKHGMKGVSIDFVRPAINIRPLSSVVAEAWGEIQKVQQRLTTDVRAEDDIVNITLGGHGGTEPGEVRVVLRAHTHFNDADITKAVNKHLEKAGFSNAHITFIRPAIDPIFIHPPGPVTGGLTPVPTNKMKAKVDVFAAHIRTVQSRLTEELRIEDAVKTIKVVGAKVVLTLQPQSAFEKDKVVAWAKEELKTRGVTLPLQVK